MDCAEKELKRAIASSLPLVVWGFGGMISFIVKNLRQYGVDIAYIVDNDPKRWGSAFQGIEVISFETLKRSFADCNVLIGVCTKKFVDEIRAQIEKDGQFKNVFFFEMFYPFGHFAQDIIDANRRKIDMTRSLFADEKSLLVYDAKIRYLQTKELGSFESLRDPEHDQYFDKAIVDVNGDEGLFIDGGAYHGENTRTLFERFPQARLRAVCIDPDEANIAALNAQYKDNDQVTIRHAALFERSGVVKFENSGSRGGGVDSSGSIELNAIGIDDEYGDSVVRFIKLDIEGAEMACLRGAKRTIETSKPIVAVCIYHSIEDHFDIPLLLKSLRPDYRFYVRQYHYTGIETVLYAV